MVTKRIIPCLDVKEGRVVKGIQFRDLKDSGDPVQQAARYGREGADELVFLDIGAGVEGRATALEMVSAVAREVFIPFTVGGGIRRVEDAKALLLAGCDKVSVNSAAVRRPELINELAERFGRQSVVLAVDVRRLEGDWQVVVDAGRTPTGWRLADWLDEATRRGAGEVLLTSMDRDGGSAGYDLEALGLAAARLRVPLVASGGFGRSLHAAEAFRAGADAALLASALHTGGLTVKRLKEELMKEGIEVRPC